MYEFYVVLALSGSLNYTRRTEKQEQMMNNPGITNRIITCLIVRVSNLSEQKLKA